MIFKGATLQVAFNVGPKFSIQIGSDPLISADFVFSPGVEISGEFAYPPFPGGTAPAPDALFLVDDACPIDHYVEFNVSVYADAIFHLGRIYQITLTSRGRFDSRRRL